MPANSIQEIRANSKVHALIVTIFCIHENGLHYLMDNGTCFELQLRNSELKNKNWVKFVYVFNYVPGYWWTWIPFLLAIRIILLSSQTSVMEAIGLFCRFMSPQLHVNWSDTQNWSRTGFRGYLSTPSIKPKSLGWNVRFQAHLSPGNVSLLKYSSL